MTKLGAPGWKEKKGWKGKRRGEEEGRGELEGMGYSKWRNDRDESKERDILIEGASTGLAETWL